MSRRRFRRPGRGGRVAYSRPEVVSAVGGVIGALSAGELSLVTGRDGLGLDELRDGLVGLEGRLRPYPDALWSWLDEHLILLAVEGTSPVEHETVVPVWTDEGAARRGLRLRLVSVGTRGFLDARIVGVEDVDRVPEWAGFTGVSADEPAASLAMPGDNAVPERWRPALREVVSRLARGDFDGLARDGVLAPVGHPSHTMVREGGWRPTPTGSSTCRRTGGDGRTSPRPTTAPAGMPSSCRCGPQVRVPAACRWRPTSTTEVRTTCACR